MMRSLLAATTLTLVAGTPLVAQVPTTPARPAPGSTVTRAFFDSLATPRVASSTTALEPDAGVAWLDLLQDSVLVGLVTEGVTANRDVRLAQARLREFRAQVGVAKAGYLPELSANAGFARQQTVFGTLGTFGFDAWRATADLAWELDFWGRIRGNVRGASLDVAAEREEHRATVLALVSDIATAYLELRELDAGLAIAERTLATRRQTLALAQRRLAEGVISELDVRQFEAEVASPASRVAEFTRLIAEREHQLSQLLGRVPGPIARGRPLAEVAKAVTVPEQVSAERVAARPDVQRAIHELNAASARAGVARTARLPRVLLSGQYGTQALEASEMFKSSTEIYTIQGGISIPLFTGGRIRNEIAAADARVEQAELRYERAALTAMREVSDALVGVRTARDQVAAQEMQTRALQRAYALAERRYEAGVSSYLELLDAQRGLFNAELGLVQAERAYLVSAVKLVKAVGGSW
ncbi:MAG TPA: TolC family protein [Gemmatimonadales bacterium]|nr:TolC family protein [Gemmatimonadales bacterium]